jgi:hypothetical protein
MDEDPAVQLDAPGDGDGPLHRQARQLVAEPDREPLVAQHPRPQALVDRGRVGGGDRLQQPQLDAVGDDRRGVQRAAGHRRQPGGAGEHGVADGRRDLPARGAEHLGDEERVAAGGPVQAVGVDSFRAASVATASLDSAGSSMRRTQRAVARSPITVPRGCAGPTSSSR